MSSLRPSPDEERWLTVGWRLREHSEDALIEERTGGWSTVRLLTRVALFALGLFIVGLILTIVGLVGVRSEWWPVGLLVVFTAEALIVARRVFWTGIEEALEVAGFVLFVAQVIFNSTRVDTGVSALLLAGAFAVPGLRLLNPLFTTLSALALSFAVGVALGFNEARWPAGEIGPSLFCVGVALLALALGSFRFRRPAHDRMVDWLVVAMPLTAYLWAGSGHDWTASREYLRTHGLLAVTSIVLPLVFGASALVVGIRRRTHAPLLSFAVCIACLAYELRNLTGMPVEVRLILWGVVLLCGAVALERVLRTPRNGITSQKVRDHEGALELLQLAGVAAATPGAPPPPAQGFAGAGGTYSGGGASGKY